MTRRPDPPSYHSALDLTGNGEWIALPWDEAQWLKGHFLPAPMQAGPAPAILYLGSEEDGDPMVAELCRRAHRRGLSLLLLNLGDLTTRDYDTPGHRFDREAAISSFVDHLQTRSDIDPDRIAIYGRGLLAALATRIAGYDGRFAAAVCDAGIWDFIERAMMDRSFSGGEPHDTSLDLFAQSSIALAVHCPILVAVGDDDWLEPDYAYRCCSQLSAADKQIAFTVLPGRAALNDDVVFDWLAQHLGPMARIAATA